MVFYEHYIGRKIANEFIIRRGDDEMVIGIDIDDTLTNTSELLLAYAQKYDYEVLKREHSLDKNKVYSIINGGQLEYGMDWTKAQANDFKESFHTKVLENAPIKSFAKEVIDKLMEEGNQIIFVTARNNEGDRIQDSYKVSKNLLDQNDIKYHKIITECSDKLSVCRENNIDLFIDDKIETCLELKDGKIHTFLMNTPFNNQLDERNIVRVFSWIDLYYKIKELKERI